MSITVIMPQLGESVVEGKVSKWLKKEGDTIKRLEPILEVETDKVTTEVTAEEGGTLLKIYVPEGETVKAGTPLATIGAVGEAVPAGAPPAAAGHSHAPAAPAAQRAASGNGKGQPRETSPREGKAAFVSPVVARIAAEHDVDVAQVPGSGQGGRVTKQDILAFVERRGQGAPAESVEEASEKTPEKAIQTAFNEPTPATAAAVEAQAPAPWETPGSGDLFRPTDDIYKAVTDGQKAAAQAASAASAAPAAPAAAPAPTPAPAVSGDQVVPLSTMRRAIAEHMVRSERTSPHVTTVFEVDMSAVLRHLNANKDAFEREGVRLTFTPYFVAATVSALKTYPLVNSSWSDEGVVLHRAINVGMAVSLGGEGLIVPVIKNGGDYSLLGLARTVNDLAARARARQLKPDEVQGGTFTITNHGVSGSLLATPIINQPQVAILGVGVIEKRVKIVDDAIAIRPMCYITLTFDHRVLDGASGDAFAAHVKRTLETWP